MQKEESKKQNSERKKMEDKTIYIGMKPFMNYVMALFTLISERRHEEIKVIARGKFISRAVDVVEIAKKRFSEGQNKIGVKNIKIASEKFNKIDDRGKERQINVSVIEITVVRIE